MSGYCHVEDGYVSNQWQGVVPDNSVSVSSVLRFCSTFGYVFGLFHRYYCYDFFTRENHPYKTFSALKDRFADIGRLVRLVAQILLLTFQ